MIVIKTFFNLCNQFQQDLFNIKDSVQMLTKFGHSFQAMGPGSHPLLQRTNQIS